MKINFRLKALESLHQNVHTWSRIFRRWNYPLFEIRFNIWRLRWIMDERRISRGCISSSPQSSIVLWVNLAKRLTLFRRRRTSGSPWLVKRNNKRRLKICGLTQQGHSIRCRWHCLGHHIQEHSKGQKNGYPCKSGTIVSDGYCIHW